MINTDNMQQEKLGTLPYVLGGMSFIPLIGVLFGIVSIVWGLTEVDKKIFKRDVMFYFLMPNSTLINRVKWLNATFLCMVAAIGLWIILLEFRSAMPNFVVAAFVYASLLALPAYLYYLRILDDLAFKAKKNGSLWVLGALFGPLGILITYLRMRSIAKKMLILELSKSE